MLVYLIHDQPNRDGRLFRGQECIQGHSGETHCSVQGGFLDQRSSKDTSRGDRKTKKKKTTRNRKIKKKKTTRDRKTT